MSPATAAPAGGGRRRVAAGIVAGAAIATFLPALRNGFVSYDDPAYVLDNPLIRSLDLHLLVEATVRFHALLWIPLVWVSLAVDHAVSGLQPLGYHLTNVLLHGCAVALVLALAVRLRAIAAGGSTGTDREARAEALVAGIAAALLFGIHPLRVESVAWVTERKDVLSGPLYLASLLAYLRYAAPSAGAHRRSRAAYLGTLGLFLAALLAKPMAVSLPVVLLVLDAYPLRRLRGWRSVPRLAAEKLPFLLAAAGDAYLTARAQRPIMMTLEQTSLAGRVLIAAHSLLAYLGRMLWPAGLAPFHPHPNDAVLSSPWYLAAVPAVLAVTAALVALGRRHPALPAAWAAYVVMLLPVLGLVQVAAQENADRFTYLPSVGPSILAGAGFARLLRGARSALGRRLVLAAGVAALGASAALTVRQISFWRDGVAFWSRVISVHPDAGIAYYERAADRLERGRLAEALADLTVSVEIAERKRFWHRSKVYDARGMVLAAMGNDAAALADFTAAIELAGEPDPLYREHRAGALERLGRSEEAARDRGAARALRSARGRPEPPPPTGSTRSAATASGTAGR